MNPLSSPKHTAKTTKPHGMRYRDRLVLGSVITLEQRVGEAYRGEKGVCYEVFQTRCEGELIEGYSFIFERGYCTSLLPNEIDSSVIVTGRVSHAHQYRWFTYFNDVIQHWREGGFDEAFRPRACVQLVKSS